MSEAPNPADRPYAYLKWEREQFADWYADAEAQDKRAASLRRAAERKQRAKTKKAKETRAARKEWQAGVAKIMAEVRRREAERALPEPPFYSSDNPLDGERLWS